MKKLENIPKKEIFSVPEGYFDGLPAKIQARISAENPSPEPSFIVRYKLQYALPVIIIMAVGIFWITETRQPADVDTLLASVETADLVMYLDNDADITTDDLLENVQFDAMDLEAIESEVYELNIGSEELNDVFDEMDLENI
jgi:hypothetical protein